MRPLTLTLTLILALALALALRPSPTPKPKPNPVSQATLAPDYATLTELETLMRNGKSALAQEGGAAGREALRCFGALAERCQQSLVIACMQMEACLRASPERGASQVVPESQPQPQPHLSPYTQPCSSSTPTLTPTPNQPLTPNPNP